MRVCILSLVTQHAKRSLLITLSSVACLALPHFFTLSHKGHDFGENVFEPKIIFFISVITCV